MLNVIAPLAVAALIWWLSTSALLWLVGQRVGLRHATAVFLTVLAVAATVFVSVLRENTSQLGAYAGFIIGILLWAWHESMFLFGYISGPRRTSCPPDLKGFARFTASAETVIYHELVIAVHAVIILLISLGASNTIAAMTFFLLWGMRLSTKLVIFLGAPNVSAHFLPKHLEYLATYFKTSRVSRLFILFAAFAISVSAGLIHLTLASPSGSFAETGYLLMATLASLAVVEHMALVMPIPDDALWAWAKPKSTATETTEDNFDYGRFL